MLNYENLVVDWFKTITNKNRRYMHDRSTENKDYFKFF